MNRVFAILILTLSAGLAQEHGTGEQPLGDSTGHSQAPMEHSTSAGQEHAQAAAKHGEGHEEAPMPNEIWWKWANFAVLAGGLGYLIGKNAGPFFRNRSEEIQKDIREAAQIRKDAEARATEIEARISNLAREVETLRAKASQEIAAEAARVEAERDAEMRKIQAYAERDIASASKQARMQLKAYSAQLAIELAEQQIRQQLDQRTHEDLTNGFIQDLRRENGAASAGGGR